LRVLSPIIRAELPMHADLDHDAEMPTGLPGRTLAAAAVGCLLLAGILLWASRGEAIFSDVVLAALAWCF
jgi:hypothetical protein